MTEKEVTTILYQNINNASRIEIKTVNDRHFYIFKTPSEENYMVCEFVTLTNNSHSNVLKTITECYEWINQKTL